MPMMKPKPHPHPPLKTTTYVLDIVSDATGSLAGHMINSVLTQFPDLKAKYVYPLINITEMTVEETAATILRLQGRIHEQLKYT